MANLAQVLLLFFGATAFIGGIVLALLGARGAPDGFEDQEGFHVGRTPDAAPAESIFPPRKTPS
jgi:hypothetical protein